eukprot:3122264-Rhodomonas_salina.1
MPAQSKQCPTAVLALCSAAFLPRVQLLAGCKDTTTMGDDEDIGIHIRHGARPSSMGMVALLFYSFKVWYRI